MDDLFTLEAGCHIAEQPRCQGSPPASGSPLVLDACCGSRKFWFDRDDTRALYIDRREGVWTVSDPSKPTGERRVEVKPDQVADFRNMPFADESFALVVFDPPHIKVNRTGEDSRMAVNYGTLGFGWREDLAAGFRECFRVLKSDGTLVFKWAETNIKLGEVLALAPQRPLFGNRMPKLSGTHWVVFLKENTKDMPPAGSASSDCSQPLKP